MLLQLLLERLGHSIPELVDRHIVFSELVSVLFQVVLVESIGKARLRGVVIYGGEGELAQLLIDLVVLVEHLDCEAVREADEEADARGAEAPIVLALKVFSCLRARCLHEKNLVESLLLHGL